MHAPKTKLHLRKETLRNLQTEKRSMQRMKTPALTPYNGGSSWVCSAIGGAMVSRWICDPIMDTIESKLESCKSCEAAGCSVSCPEPTPPPANSYPNMPKLHGF